MSVGQCLCVFCARRISPVPPMPSKGTGFPTRKSHESRAGCRGCLCETQTALPECTEPSIGFVMVLPWGFALQGHCISHDSDHPTQPCAHLWRELALPSPFGCCDVPRAHSVHNPVIPGGNWRCLLCLWILAAVWHREAVWAVLCLSLHSSLEVK